MLNWIQQNLPLLIVLLSFGASGLGWVFKQAEEARKRKAADQARERARLEALRTGTFQSRAPTVQQASSGGAAERTPRVLTPRERIEELSRRRQQGEASQRDRRRQELEAQLQRRREAAEAQRRQRTATQSPSSPQTPARGSQRQTTARQGAQRPAQSPYQTPSQSQQRSGQQPSRTQVRVPSQGQTAGPQRPAASARAGSSKRSSPSPKQARQPVRQSQRARDQSPYAIGSGRLPTESDGAPEVASLPSLRTPAAAKSPSGSIGGGMGGLSRAELRRGVILREVFDLPLALRAPVEGSGF